LCSMVFQLDIGDKVTHIFAISSKGGELYDAFRVANSFPQASLPTDDISLSPPHHLVCALPETSPVGCNSGGNIAAEQHIA
jgi:hypothetical protein